MNREPLIRLHCTECDSSAGHIYRHPDGQLFVIAHVSRQAGRRGGRHRTKRATPTIVEFAPMSPDPDADLVALAQCRCAEHHISELDMEEAADQGVRRVKVTPSNPAAWREQDWYTTSLPDLD